MISVSNEFKQAITLPRHLDGKIVIGNDTITSEQFYSIERIFKTDLFKTVMKQVIVDSQVPIDKGSVINPQLGVYVGDDFEYLSLGNYTATKEPNLNKDTKSYQISTYDKIVESMVDYGLTIGDISYPCSVRDLFVAIFTKLGWSTSGIPQTFTNSTSLIEEDVYSNANMTYRSVLDELCTISCMFLLEKNGLPSLIQKNTTSEVIDEYYMNNTNVTIKEKVYFNSLVFSRASESDNIFRNDSEDIELNGLHEYKVSDLQILSLNWRDNFIDEMWNYIKTFEYYSYDIDTKGIGFLEPIDEFILRTFEDDYNTLLLSSDLVLRSGLKENISADAPKETQTDYKYASSTDRFKNQTYLVVDKQNQQIEALVSNTKIVSNELKGIGRVQLENAYKGTLHYLSIKGEMQPLTPSSILYPSNSLYPKDTKTLLVDDNEVKLDIDYLRYINEEVCDEFIYEEGKCKIIRRVGNNNGTYYELPSEVVEQREDALIEVDTNSVLVMKQFGNVQLKVYYLLNNEYTDNFAPTVDLISKINLSEGKALIEANKIDLVGKTFDLTADRMRIQSKNFTLDEEGNMVANSGTFNGTLSTGRDCIVGDNLKIGVNQSDEGADTKRIQMSNHAYIERIKYSDDYSILKLRGDYLEMYIEGEGGDHLLFTGQNYYSKWDNMNQNITLNYGYITSSSDIITDSDKRLKDNIKDISVDWINDLKVKEFNYKNSKDRKQIGLIAQDYLDKDYSKYFLLEKDNGYYGISYGNITNALIQYCQELNKKVENLEKKIEKLESDK